nr:hypothetical protein [uncultured archaeon]
MDTFAHVLLVFSSDIFPKKVAPPVLTFSPIGNSLSFRRSPNAKEFSARSSS